MDELISRQAAIDALKQQADTMSRWSERYAEQRKGVLTAVNIVEDLPTIQPEPHWIPVTERLPEDSVYVLLTIRRMDDSYNHVPFISTGYISWNHQCWWCAHDGNCKDANIDVLAWMPLPEPYKGVTT